MQVLSQKNDVNSPSTRVQNKYKTKYVANQKIDIVLDSRREEFCENSIISYLSNIASKLEYDAHIYDELAISVYNSLPESPSASDIDHCIVSRATEMIVEDYSYSRLATWILMTELHSTTHDDYLQVVNQLMNNVDQNNVICPILNDEFAQYVKNNITAINSAFRYSRDFEYDIFSFRTMEKAYLKRLSNDKIVERPQHMIMRVAICIHSITNDIDRVIETYDHMSQKYYTHATPTLFNAGTNYQQLSSCFLLTVDDDMEKIGELWKDCAVISKFSGGISVNVCNIRSAGSYISKTNGKSSGLRMLHVLNEISRYADQGGKRPGSIAVYIEPWHSDIEYFLELKTNTGAESEKTRNLFLAISVNDIFMRRARDDEEWCLMCPHSCPKLAGKYGADFEREYLEYEKAGNYTNKISARYLMLKIQQVLFETGVPYIVFKDNINRQSNVINIGVITSLNLCVEIALPSTANDYSTCFTKETEILTTRGMRPIAECNGSDVYSHLDNDKNMLRSPHYEKAILIENGLKEIYKLKTHGNKPLYVTADHPMLVVDSDKNCSWVKVRDLSQGDAILSPCTVPVPFYDSVNKYNYDLEFIVHAWAISDSRLVASGVDNGIESDFIRSLSELSTRESLGISEQTIMDTYNNAMGKHPRLTISDKRVPGNVIAAAPTQISNYISTLFSLDGKIKYDNNIPSIYMRSNSIDFLYDIQSMLLPFGIPSRVCNVDRTVDECEIVITGRMPLHRYRKYIDFMMSPDKKFTFYSIRKNRNTRSIKYYNRSTVETVARHGIDVVYDLNLPMSHNYIANGLVVHNCNLSSICLPKFVKMQGGNAKFDYGKLHEISQMVTRNLNNVIDASYNPVEKTIAYNKNNRPIGIGIQGLADVFCMFRTPFDSKLARDINIKISETIYHGSLTESLQLAKERGRYPAFDGSPLSEGKFQFDLWGEGNYRLSGLWDWGSLREQIMKHGVLNCLTTAYMPTASTSQIMGNNECIEPYTENIYVRSTGAGEFYVLNKYLREDLTKLGMWNQEMINMIKYCGGSIAKIPGIPDSIKKIYRTTWEIPQKSIIDMSADRGPFIDNSQSLNIHITKPSYAILNSCLYRAWSRGLKTGLYYLRTKPDSTATQFGIDEADKNKFRELFGDNACDIKHDDDGEQPAIICYRRPKNLGSNEECIVCSS